jgi:hypothetical protein
VGVRAPGFFAVKPVGFQTETLPGRDIGADRRANEHDLAPNEIAARGAGEVESASFVRARLAASVIASSAGLIARLTLFSSDDAATG